MNKVDNQNFPRDPELEALLDLVRDTPTRDPKALAHGRAQFINDVDKAFSTNSIQPFSWVKNLLAFEWLGQINNSSGMNRSMKLSYSVLLGAALILVILLSGAGATAYASQSALPGDALYSLKMSIEQTQVRLAADAAKQAELHLEFAERRLGEISGLIAEGRYTEIEQSTQEFEYHVQKALEAMQTVAAGNPLRAQELAVRVTAALSKYARTLASMMMNVPESTRESMERAIITSQNAGNKTPAEINIENESTNEEINVDAGNSNIENNGNLPNNQTNEFFNANENGNVNDISNSNLNSNENETVDDTQENNNGNNDGESNSNENDRDDDDNKSGNTNDRNDDNRNENDHDNRNDGGDNHNDSGGHDNGNDD